MRYFFHIPRERRSGRSVPGSSEDRLSYSGAQRGLQPGATLETACQHVRLRALSLSPAWDTAQLCNRSPGSSALRDPLRVRNMPRRLLRCASSSAKRLSASASASALLLLCFCSASALLLLCFCSASALLLLCFCSAPALLCPRSALLCYALLCSALLRTDRPSSHHHGGIPFISWSFNQTIRNQTIYIKRGPDLNRTLKSSVATRKQS